MKSHLEIKTCKFTDLHFKQLMVTALKFINNKKLTIL